MTNIRFITDGHKALDAYGRMCVARVCTPDRVNEWDKVLVAMQDRIIEGDYQVVIDYERGCVGDEYVFKSKEQRRIEGDLGRAYLDMMETLANANPLNPDDEHAINREIQCYNDAKAEYKRVTAPKVDRHGLTDEDRRRNADRLDQDDVFAEIFLEAEEGARSARPVE